MHSAFNMLDLLILCSHLFLYGRAMCSLEKLHLKITIIIHIGIVKVGGGHKQVEGHWSSV